MAKLPQVPGAGLPGRAASSWWAAQVSQLLCAAVISPGGELDPARQGTPHLPL